MFNDVFNAIGCRLSNSSQLRSIFVRHFNTIVTTPSSQSFFVILKHPWFELIHTYNHNFPIFHTLLFSQSKKPAKGKIQIGSVVFNLDLDLQCIFVILFYSSILIQIGWWSPDAQVFEWSWGASRVSISAISLLFRRVWTEPSLNRTTTKYFLFHRFELCYT